MPLLPPSPTSVLPLKSGTQDRKSSFLCSHCIVCLSLTVRMEYIHFSVVFIVLINNGKPQIIIKVHLFLWIKFYWNTVMFLHLHRKSYNSFYPTMAELNSYNRETKIHQTFGSLALKKYDFPGIIWYMILTKIVSDFHHSAWCTLADAMRKPPVKLMVRSSMLAPHAIKRQGGKVTHFSPPLFWFLFKALVRMRKNSWH